jgi:uncharacterized protein (TIGR00661 family)
LPINATIQKVLIAPLDWGLGHATRCIPIIEALLSQELTVIIAAEGSVAALLREAFPSLKIIPLKGYRVQYASKSYTLLFKLLAQLPKIYSTIQYENEWIKKIVRTEKIDLIIADNRFGCYHSTVPSVFITHQLTIKTPLLWVEKLLQKLNYRYINRFSACWIPDMAAFPGLAAKLSHPTHMPSIPVHYINLLSRFVPQPIQSIFAFGIILSGPEPQRSILENKLVLDLQKIKEPVFLVRGKPASKEIIHLPSSVTVFNHLDTIELQALIAKTDYIICRGGYTSLMELFSLRKKLIIVPTPAQTEQEYLSQQLLMQCRALAIPQYEFDTEKAMELAASFPYQFVDAPLFSKKDIIPLLQSLIP